MKDYKAECDKLRGQLLEQQKTIDYLRAREEARRVREDEVRDKFKELLIEVLGR